MSDEISTLAGWLSEARSAVFFGGAGVSTESGVPDFRSAAGLYSRTTGSGFSAEYLLSSDALQHHPEHFFCFIRENLLISGVRPNAAHTSLARLERAGHLAAVVTQNIDGLHQAAGSQNVWELHGSLERWYCSNGHQCGLDDIPPTPVIPQCSHDGMTIRPDVVLYGEGLDDDVLRGAVDAISSADVLIVGGTSLNVYPAAGLLRYYEGDRLVVINLEEIPTRADLQIIGKVGETLAATLGNMTDVV